MEWIDLLGTPWKRFGKTREEGMCCATVSQEILRRCGHAFDPDFLLLPRSGAHRCQADRSSTDLDYAESLARYYTLLGKSAWEATRRGDLVLSMSEHRGGALFVLVEPSKGTFLTASHRRGVVSVPRRAIRNIIGVYRLGGDE